ncbi:MAG: hypothetical protein ABEJ79_04550 [Halolamina sp.]
MSGNSTSVGARVTIGGVGLLALVMCGLGFWLWSSFDAGAGSLVFGVVAALVALVALYAAATDPEWLEVESRVRPSDAELRERRSDEPGFEDE